MTAKKRRAASHIASASDVTLKATRAGVGVEILSRHELTKPSSATSVAPAAGPNSNAAMIVNVSESEKLIGKPGRRTVANAEAVVNPASTSHNAPGGLAINSTADQNKTSEPDTITPPRYARRTSPMPGRARIVDCRSSDPVIAHMLVRPCVSGTFGVV